MIRKRPKAKTEKVGHAGREEECNGFPNFIILWKIVSFPFNFITWAIFISC